MRTLAGGADLAGTGAGGAAQTTDSPMGATNPAGGAHMGGVGVERMLAARAVTYHVMRWCHTTREQAASVASAATEVWEGTSRPKWGATARAGRQRRQKGSRDRSTRGSPEGGSRLKYECTSR